MNRLFVFGCSYSSVYDELVLGDPSIKAYSEYRGGNLPKTWSELLADDYGYELINEAGWGICNYTIFERFCKQIPNIKTGDVVIIGWTETSRYRLYNDQLDRYEDLGAWSKEDRSILDNISQNTMDEILINRSFEAWSNEVRSWIVAIEKLSELIGFKVLNWTFFEYLAEIGVADDLEGIQTITHETNGEIKNEHIGEQGHVTQCEYFKKRLDGTYEKNISVAEEQDSGL